MCFSFRRVTPETIGDRANCWLYGSANDELQAAAALCGTVPTVGPCLESMLQTGQPSES